MSVFCLFIYVFFVFILSNAVEDWDTFEKLLDYMYAKDIKSESALHPVVMSEASVSQIAVYILVLVIYACTKWFWL